LAASREHHRTSLDRQHTTHGPGEAQQHNFQVIVDRVVSKIGPLRDQYHQFWRSTRPYLVAIHLCECVHVEVGYADEMSCTDDLKTFSIITYSLRGQAVGTRVETLVVHPLEVGQECIGGHELSEESDELDVGSVTRLLNSTLELCINTYCGAVPIIVFIT
jgi:hypothetical protein